MLNNLLNRLYGEMAIALDWKSEAGAAAPVCCPVTGARKYHANDLAGDALRGTEQLLAELEATACSGMARGPYAR